MGGSPPSSLGLRSRLPRPCVVASCPLERFSAIGHGPIFFCFVEFSSVPEVLTRASPPNPNSKLERHVERFGPLGAGQGFSFFYPGRCYTGDIQGAFLRAVSIKERSNKKQ